MVKAEVWEEVVRKIRGEVKEGRDLFYKEGGEAV